MLKNTENSYGSITKIFHWVVALAIISLIAVGFTMHYMEPSPEKFELYGMHKASGVLVFMLVALRISWRFINQTVLPAKDLPNMLKLGAKAGHFMLYIFMLVMPISGITMSIFAGYDIPVFGLFTIPAMEKNLQIAGIAHTLHEIAAWGFAIMIVLHILAALYHHFIRRDDTLKKMV
ncbi:MAG: hypothetical protein COA94_04635 [Rickettsiales bacterium]|nr:MAG: hypothetical protein COA94_04635 [Rickettsiales bacterium]